MSHLHPGLISAYNSLTDRHLAGYFSNTRIRRHLQRAGLITRSGRIVPDKEYRHKLIQRANQRHIRECLAQAIFYKVLEMERLHQKEIKRKLEEYARREKVHKIKVDRTKRYEDDVPRILSPHPPMGARAVHKQYSGPEGEPSESSDSPSSSRPNTAPGKMQRPVRLKPIHSNTTTMSLRRSSPYRTHQSSQGHHPQTFNCTTLACPHTLFQQMDKHSGRGLKTMETPPHNGISPYCLPVINNFVTPVPPTTMRRERGGKVTRSTVRARRLRSTTASSGADVTEDLPLLRSSIEQSKVFVNMVYFGKSVHLSHDLTDLRDDIKVFQQHCGGENLCVFKGKLREGEMFQFFSRRHRGFPFSLTFFLNGLQVERLSSCCEFKHRKGSRLGGKHGHFGFSGVAGASPCYKCIIFMGLDKKPTPPSRTIKENGGRHTLSTSYKVRSERSGGYTASHSECETSQPLDMKTQVEEEPVCKDNKVRDEYDEDFEADDEGPAEEGAAREKNSPSRENKKQAEEKETSESEDDEKDAHSSSSSLDSDQEQSDDDTIKDDEEEKPPAEIVYEETVAEPDQTDKPKLAKDDLAALKDSDIHGSVEDSTEIEITDNSLLTGSEKRQSVLSSEDQDGKSTIDQRKDEERDRAKSVQEKLVEAILKPSHCSSEPELSDTSTEESVDEGLKHNNKDAVPEKLMIVVKEKTEFEDVVAGESELSQTREEEEEEDEALQDAQENNESIDDQEIKTDQKMTEEEDTMEAFEDLENTGEEETKLQEEIKADIHEEAKVGSSDDEASKKTAEKEEEALEEVKHGTESKEGDTSLPPEANRDTDEIAYEVESTMDVKENPPTDEQEDLHHEESAVHNAEKMQQEMEDGVSGAEDNAGSSKSTAEESEDTVKKTIDVEEEDVKHESTQDDNNRETDKAEAEGRTDGSEAEVCESGEEEDKSMQLQEKENMKIFEEEDEEKEQSHVNTGRSEKDETENEDKTFKESIEEMKNENPTEEDQDVEKAIDKEEEVTDRNVLDPEQPEEDERNVFTEESEGNGLHEGDQNTAQNEERNSEKAEYESRAGQSETMVSKTDEDNKDIETPDELDWKKENTLDGNAKNCNINTDAGEGDAKKTIEEISEKTSNELEKGSIDAENGEISAESKTCENEESPLVDEQDVIDVKSCEEEETEGVDAHENTEGCDDVNEVSEAGVFQPSGNEEVIEAEDRHEQSKNISDPEETAVDVKNRKDFGRTEESKNGTKLSLDNENQESSLIEKNNNTKSSSSELTESSVHQEQRPPSVTVILVESSEQIEDRKMKALERSEDPEGNVVRVGLSAADGGNKDTEDAIKASEDGASVLQKPQDEESDDARQVGAAGKGPPEAAAEISDLVTNWVNMHQSSKFFETFVEPLEDLSETSETPSLEMQKLAEVGGISDSEERMHMLRDQSESSVKTTMEAKETELDRIEAQNDCAKQQEKENTEVQELRSKAGSEKSNEESTKELDMPPEVHKSIKTMNNDEESTEVQSISSSHNSGAGGKHASVSGSQPVERSSGNDTDVTDKHTVAKEMEEVLLATRTEEPNHSKHPDELEDENTTQETIKDEGEKVSQMTHFASKSDVGSLQEFHREEIQAEVSEESRVEMIQDFTDQLSTFSGQDKSLFGHNSYSLMTSVRTESEH